MTGAPFKIGHLEATLDRRTFQSGSTALDRYFREQITQDVRRRIAACFVALTKKQSIAGYYTLASASVPPDRTSC